MTSPVPLVISVVLATYNGERYLSDFLRSLSQQTRLPSRLVLRDDGSVDDSIGTVSRWAEQQGVELKLVVGERLGPARSFLEALRQSDPAHVHFLADQDDVWLPTKVQTGVDAIAAGAANATPTLYASRLHVVDSDLQPLRLSNRPSCLSFRSAVCESLLTGCTMALNEPLRRLAVRGDPRSLAMHDWWLYLLATATGKVVFDPTPTLLYRQHGANALGMEKTGLPHMFERLRRFATCDVPTRSNQLREFKTLYADVMSPSALKLSNDLLAARSDALTRVRVALSAPIVRQRWHDKLSTRIAILANRF